MDIATGALIFLSGILLGALFQWKLGGDKPVKRDAKGRFAK